MVVVEDSVSLRLDQILLATDFSELSKNAMSYARGLAKHFSSCLTVTHVIDLSLASSPELGVATLPVEGMRSESEMQINRMVRELKEQGLRVASKTVESFNPALSIVEASEELHADLIILGTHARRGISRMILGSVAEAVLRHARCPVVTIGPKAKVPIEDNVCFRRILFTTDLRHRAAQNIGLAFGFARDSTAKIFLCHILKEAGEDIPDLIQLQLEAEEDLGKLIPDSMIDWCDAECTVEFGDPGIRILEVAHSLGADLIVMGARKRFGWLTQLDAGVVGHVIANSECPVMTTCSE